MTREEAAVRARAAKAAKAGSIADRFWRKVDKRGPEDCWPWIACARKPTEGYGAFWFDGRHHPAPKIAWYLTFGNLPALQTLHRCDNPTCCNPSHLFLGTNVENNADKVAKRRHVFGSRQVKAKLTETDALEIKRLKPAGRAPYGFRTELAARFGVKPGTITDIWIRSWKHI